MTQVVPSSSSRYFGRIFTLTLRGMPLKQPSEETGDADAFNEEKKRKEKDENFFMGSLL